MRVLCKFNVEIHLLFALCVARTVDAGNIVRRSTGTNCTRKGADTRESSTKIHRRGCTKLAMRLPSMHSGTWSDMAVVLERCTG